MVKKILTGLAFFTFSFPVFAQESIDIITFSGRYGVPQSYENTYAGKATEIGGMINVKIPLVFNKSTIWYNEILYSPITILNDETMSGEIANPIEVHGFILQTGLVKKFNNGTAIQILLVPRFMTDFIDVNSKNLQWGSIALFEKRYSNKLLMRFGLLYNQELFGTILTPLVYLDWQISSKWSIVGLLPIAAKVKYQANKNLALGLSHFGLTTTYRLGNIAYRNDYIERNSIDLSFFVRQRIVGHIHFEGRFGYALGRSYKQYTEDQKLDLRLIILSFGDDRIQKNVSFNNGPIASFRLIYNIPIPE